MLCVGTWYPFLGEGCHLICMTPLEASCIFCWMIFGRDSRFPELKIRHLFWITVNLWWPIAYGSLLAFWLPPQNKNGREKQAEVLLRILGPLRKPGGRAEEVKHWSTRKEWSENQGRSRNSGMATVLLRCVSWHASFFRILPAQRFSSNAFFR